jgi:predicted component of type VI protein secretion system
MLTPFRHLSATLGHIQNLLQSCRELDNLLDGKLGREAPGLVPIRVVAEAAAGMVASLLRDRGDQIQEESLPGQSVFAPLALHLPEEPYLPTSGGQIRTRADAYQLLAEAADFLSRTEPHSPTPYLIRRAIAWGSMSLEQLLPDLVSNRSDLSEIYRLLNLRSAEMEKK